MSARITLARVCTTSAYLACAGYRAAVTLYREAQRPIARALGSFYVRTRTG